MNQAKRLTHALGAEKVALDVVQSEFTAFEETIDEADAYGSAHKSEELGVPGSSQWDRFMEDLKGFDIAAKERFRRLRDKVPYTKSEKLLLGSGASETVSGSQERVLDKYNRLVGTSNSMNR